MLAGVGGGGGVAWTVVVWTPIHATRVAVVRCDLMSQWVLYGRKE
jgi:hypothetical protein